ncbi:MAG: Crp/Fnr family transcriptional regulator [Pseudobdellovibrionaceae bacterium]
MSDSTIYRKLQSFDFFRELAEVHLKEIVSRGEVLHLRPTRPLFKEGAKIEAVYLILYGSFKIQQILPEQGAVIFNFLGRGEFLGVAMASVKNATFSASAIANEESAVFKLPLKYFTENFMQYPALRQVVNQQIADRFFEFQNDRCMAKALTPQKLSNLLLRILDRQPKEHGQRLMIPITRCDMARRIGAQAETVIRVFSEWTKKGWIWTEDKHIDILNREKLEEIKNGKSSRKAPRGTSIYSATPRRTPKNP